MLNGAFVFVPYPFEMGNFCHRYCKCSPVYLPFYSSKRPERILMSGSVTLRIFRPRDLDEVHTLITRTIDESYPPFYSPLAIGFFKKYHQGKQILHDADRGLTIVLDEGGAIRATGTLVTTNIRRVFVHPESQRRGYGTVIMRELEAKGVEKGLRYVDLDASLFSKKFYLDLHYVIMNHGAYPLREDDLLGYYKMTKNLQPLDPPQWNLDGMRMRFSDGSGIQKSMERTTAYEFIQKGNFLYGGYRGGKSEFGEIIGILDGSRVEFSTVQEHLDGTTDHGRINGTVTRGHGGKIHIVDRRDSKDIRILEEI